MISSVQLKELRGVIECELPNRNLYEFAGTFKLENVPFPIPLGSDQILLRGSQLKNTEYVCGLVIYTGHETKLMMVCLISKEFRIDFQFFRILHRCLLNELMLNK
jgi:phospholipid-transporting ATPase